MKKSIDERRTLIVLVTTLCTLLGATAHAEGHIVSWERIVGIDPNPTGGQVFAGISPVTFPWSITRGRALLNATTGRLYFDVKGLSMGASPTSLATRVWE